MRPEPERHYLPDLADLFFLLSNDNVKQFSIRPLRYTVCMLQQVHFKNTQENSTPPLLAAKEVTAGYGGKPVLEHINIQQFSGEFVGLLGPNGCGKSTLLRVLSRTLKPESGTVSLEGKPITAWSAKEIACRLAFVPQSEPAVFDFSVRDLVLMGRHPHLARFQGESEEDYRIADEAMQEADIAFLSDRPITQLSGGERRRALLARALAQRTPLLLLDEPTAHLDITHQFELLSLVNKLTAEKGVGALAALHDLNQAAEFCDRLVLMSSGKILFTGTPEEVMTPDILRVAYHAEVRIGTNPETGRPMILTLQPIRS